MNAKDIMDLGLKKIHCSTARASQNSDVDARMNLPGDVATSSPGNNMNKRPKTPNRNVRQRLSTCMIPLLTSESRLRSAFQRKILQKQR